MKNPALIFGNPRPSGRTLKDGDIVIMELAAGYRGYSAQIGSPVCIGEPPTEVRRFFDEIVLPGFQHMVNVARAGHHLNELVEAARFYRRKRRSIAAHPHSRHRFRQLRAPHLYRSYPGGRVRAGASARAWCW